MTTFQSNLALGGSLARRYPDDVATIAAVGERSEAAIDELVTLIEPGDSVSLPSTLEDVAPLIRPPLTLTFTKRLVQMVCPSRTTGPADAVGIEVLSETDSADMLALAVLTQPGPFRSRTFTFGTYLGIRVHGQLAAMGGQRMHLPGYREVSAICTHPDYRGRGYARAIVLRLIEMIADEGQTPFLHTGEENRNALALYRTLGFFERARLPLVVVERRR